MDPDWKLTLWIPHLPGTQLASPNRHWRTRQAEKALWHGYVSGAVVQAHSNGIKLPRRPLELVMLNLTRCSTQRPDYDNLVTSMKAVVDGLVACRILIDDSWKHFVGERPFYYWEKAPKRSMQGVRVELWDGDCNPV